MFSIKNFTDMDTTYKEGNRQIRFLKNLRSHKTQLSDWFGRRCELVIPSTRERCPKSLFRLCPRLGRVRSLTPSRSVVGVLPRYVTLVPNLRLSTFQESLLDCYLSSPSRYSRFEVSIWIPYSALGSRSPWFRRPGFLSLVLVLFSSRSTILRSWLVPGPEFSLYVDRDGNLLFL